MHTVTLSRRRKMNITISNDTEKRFARYKGVRKGNISEALEEVIELWIRNFDDVIFTK